MHILLLQILLGIAAYMTRVVWGRNAPQPLPSMVASTVAHVAVGALLLADAWILVIQSHRWLLYPGVATAPQSDKAVTA